jgi:hypothetical protein
MPSSIGTPDTHGLPDPADHRGFVPEGDALRLGRRLGPTRLTLPALTSDLAALTVLVLVPALPLGS